MISQTVGAVIMVVSGLVLYSSIIYFFTQRVHKKTYEKIYKNQAEIVFIRLNLQMELYSSSELQESMINSDCGRVLAKISNKNLTKKNMLKLFEQHITEVSFVMNIIYDKVYGADYYKWSRQSGTDLRIKEKISDKVFLSKRGLVKRELDKIVNTPFEDLKYLFREPEEIIETCDLCGDYWDEHSLDCSC